MDFKLVVDGIRLRTSLDGLGDGSEAFSEGFHNDVGIDANSTPERSFYSGFGYEVFQKESRMHEIIIKSRAMQ